MAKKKADGFADYKKFRTWQEAHKLSVKVFQKLKDDKQDVLSNSLKKNSVMVCNNLARGYHKRSIVNKIDHFYSSQDLLTSFENSLLIAKDLDILTTKEFDEFAENIKTISMMNFGMIRRLKEVQKEQEKKAAEAETV